MNKSHYIEILSFTCVILLICLNTSVEANNITVHVRPYLSGYNEVEGTVFLKFGVKWENSWKVNRPRNWDAAWIFAKYRDGGGPWEHIYIDTSAQAHKVLKASTAVTIKVGTSKFLHDNTLTGKNEEMIKGLGVFLYRTNNGDGDLVIDSVALKWKYTDQNLEAESIISLRVFAIEMVYIPKGAFCFGDPSLPLSENGLRLQPDSGYLTSMNKMPFNNPGFNTKPIPLFTRNAVGGVYYPFGSVNAMQNGVCAEYTDYVRIYRPPINASFGDVRIPLSQNLTHRNPSVAKDYLRSAQSVYPYHTYTLRMPSPYRASHFFFSYADNNGGSPQVSIKGFFVEASNDSLSWTLVAGDRATSGTEPLILPGNLASIPYKAACTSPKAYLWYRFHFFTGDYLYLTCFSPIDEVGYSENQFYYNWNRPYQGSLPLKYTGGEITAPDNVSSITYPNGYESFYIMKHELSQHAYVDFLNCLTFNQQQSHANDALPDGSGKVRFHDYFRCWVALRTPSGSSEPAIYHNKVSSQNLNIGNPEFHAGNVAMTALSWKNIAGYLAWSGLRPLTELEYEKACRGSLNVVAGEYAWGNSITVLTNGTPPTHINEADEMASPPYANFINQNSPEAFPMRVGCLATSNSYRAEAGASFYGVLNLSDNVSEVYINCDTKEGLAFDGEHGPGFLKDGSGYTPVVSWGPETGESLLIRGVYKSNVSKAQVSDRYFKNITNIVNKTPDNNYIGCRGGRTAPR